MTTTIETKERPILFSGEMVKAILDGRKTQTRRIVKPQPQLSADGYRWQWKGKEIGTDNPIRWIMLDRCPYGQAGDRLWVREAFYDRADYAAIGKLNRDRFVYVADGVKAGWKAKPSIHMPRLASRITLEITDVRIERLQDISGMDVVAEGVDCSGFVLVGGEGFELKAAIKFAQLWNSINSACTFGDNPWVWVIKFKKV